MPATFPEDLTMTAIDTTLRATGFAFSARLTRGIETLADRLSDARKRRATRIALDQLTDSQLTDIGLTRADVFSRF